MTPSNIISGLKTQLKNYSGLSSVKEVYLGPRVDIPRENFPFLIIDWSSDSEGLDYIGANTVNNLNLIVYGYIYQETADSMFSDQLALLNNVKKAIASDNTLGGKCEGAFIENCDNDLDVFPIRGFALKVRCTYKQDYTNRT